MAEAAPVGVVVMAYGTPRSPADIEAYYTHIRRGRPPTAEQLADLTARYDALGGTSPLAARTRAQIDAVAGALDAAEPGRFRVALGQKHAAPFIEDAVEELAGAGVGYLVGLVLAPHYSALSVGQYLERLGVAATARGLEWKAVRAWHAEPAYLHFLTQAVTEGLAGLPERTKVLFTAHSLPRRVLELRGPDGHPDPYPEQLREAAAAVAGAVGLDPWAGWSICWQSAGRTPEPWLGPDLLEVIDDLAATGRADGVLVCPHGFVSDHLEVLYDLDVEAQRRAADAGLAFARTRVLNDHPPVMQALAGRVAALAA